MLIKRALILLAILLIAILVFTSVADYIHCIGPLREAAAQKVGAIRLWEIGKALGGYRLHHGRLPPSASHDADGRPLLSWRVHLLPFLGEQELYNKFHLDEPWDSKHNASIVLKMPDVYNFDPGNKNADVADCLGKTCCLALTGDNTLFSASDANGSLTAKEMESEEIVVVEVDESHATTWTKPNDVDTTPPLLEQIGGVSGRRKGKVLALLAKGWVVLVTPKQLGNNNASKTATVVLKKVIEGTE